MSGAAEQGGGVVRYGFRRMREDSEINVRRSRHVCIALLEDAQLVARDDRFIFWGVGVLRHREGGDDGDRDQVQVQELGIGSRGSSNGFKCCGEQLI